MDPSFGEGYEQDRNQPSRLRFVAALGVDAELMDITNATDIQVIRESVRFDRDTENGSVASLTFDAALPNKAFQDIPTRRYISVDDPDLANGLGGYAGIFSGEIISVDVKEDGDERILNLRCSDWGDLMRRPPKQITTPWPPGDGTPVVDTTVEAAVVAGTGVVVTPRSMRHIYVGKRLYASNSDGSNQERITVTAVTATTFTADFDTDKDSTETTVQLSMHAKGLQTIEPDSMVNINVGSLIYCYKTHGVQTVGNEWTVVESVTATTFDAVFIAWKSHDWVVRSEWRLFGGVSARELIADGFYMHLDDVDPDDGSITSDMVWIPSLLDEFFNNEGFQVFKTAVNDLIPSLPHGQWEATDPSEVMNWVVEQNKDLAIWPTWHMSFKQGTSTSYSVLAPMLRFYDSRNVSVLAPVKLTNTQVSYDQEEMARFIDYARREDGAAFANRQTVVGGNFAQGEWNDLASQTDPDALNYVGRVIEAPVVSEQILITNAECQSRAEQLATELKLSMRPRPVTVTTYAKIAEFILYEPSRVAFEAIWEQDLPASFDVTRVSLSFTEEGLAKYDFQLGIRRIPWLPGNVRVPRNTRRANVLTGPRGKIRSVSHQITEHVDTHRMLRGEADVYVVDTSLREGNTYLYLPRASLNPGLPVTIKVPESITEPSSGNVYIQPFSREGIADTIDGYIARVVYPGDTVTMQSDGEHDRTGKGGNWNILSATSSRPMLAWIEVTVLLPIPIVMPWDGISITEMTIWEWEIWTDAVGSIELDALWNGNNLTGSSPIVVTADNHASGDTTGWDQSVITASGLLTFAVVSSSGVSRIRLRLGAERPIYPNT